MNDIINRFISMKRGLLIFVIYLSGTFNCYTQTTPREYYNIGLKAFLDADFQNSIQNFNEYIKSFPDDYTAYNYRGLSYQSLKDYDNALKDFTSVIKYSSFSSLGYLNRANTFMLSGRDWDALTDYNAGLEIEPDNTQLFIGRSHVFAKRHDYVSALNELSQASIIDSTIAKIYINKAWVHTLANDTIEVFQDICDALNRDTNIILSDIRSDLRFVKADQYRKVLDFHSSIIKANPVNYMAYFNRGVVYFFENLYDRAKVDFDKALELNNEEKPGFSDTVGKFIRLMGINR